MDSDVFTFIVGGKAGEGVKKAGSVAAHIFSSLGRHVFQMDDYMSIINKTGFADVKVQKETLVNLPDEILSKYLTDTEKEEFANGTIGIYSITVYGKRPMCEPGSGCC